MCIRDRRGEGSGIGSRAFAEGGLRSGRDSGSAARLDVAEGARVRERGADARERERAEPRERGAESSRVASDAGSARHRRRVPTDRGRPRSARPDRAGRRRCAPRGARREATRRAPHGASGRVARSGEEGADTTRNLPIWPKNIDKKMSPTYARYGSPHCFPKNIGVVPRMATTEPMSARGVTGSSFTIFPRGNAYIGPTHMSVEKTASDDTRNNA